MVSREELYELVWSMPMTKAARKYSVSGATLPVFALLFAFRGRRGVIGQSRKSEVRRRDEHYRRPYLAINFSGRGNAIRRRPESAPRSPQLWRHN
jgi:hypothetical protein